MGIRNQLWYLICRGFQLAQGREKNGETFSNVTLVKLVQPYSRINTDLP